MRIILLGKLEIVWWSPFKSVEIYMKDILWPFVHLRRINNVPYGFLGLYQILIPMQSSLGEC